MSTIATKNYFRKHPRAPLRTSVIYFDGEYVQRARLLNISLSGLLIDELPYFPSAEILHAYVDIPRMPLLKSIDMADLWKLKMVQSEHFIFPCIISIVRKVGKNLGLDQLMRLKLGGTFVESEKNRELQVLVKEYIEHYAYNLVFLVRLLENLNLKEEEEKQALLLAEILGLDCREGIMMLRERVALEYRNL